MKGNHYLAVANEFTQIITHDASGHTKVNIVRDYEVSSVIYWWSGRFFVEWQKIQTNGAIRWTSIDGPNGEVVLAVINSKSQPLLYTYDALRGIFKPTEFRGLSSGILQFPKNQTDLNIRSIKGFKMNGTTYIAVANFAKNSGREHNLFKLTFEYKPSPQLSPTLGEAINSTLVSITRQLLQLKNKLSELSKKLSNVMTTNTVQTITNFTYFNNITIKGTLTVGNLLYTGHVENNPVVKAVKHGLELKKNITQQEKRIAELLKELQDCVSKNGTQIITGKKIFNNTVTFGNLSAVQMKTGIIDGVNLTDLNSRTWKRNGNQTFYGRYTFVRNLTAMKDLNVKGLINGLHIPNDVMTTTTTQVVTGVKTFKEDLVVVGNITTKNYTFNSINIPDDLVLKSKDQIIKGKKTFKGDVTFLSDVEVNGTVNGKDLSEFSGRVVTLSTDQEITGKKTFTTGFNVIGDLQVNGLIDGINLTEFIEDAVTLDTSQNITGIYNIFSKALSAGCIGV